MQIFDWKEKRDFELTLKKNSGREYSTCPKCSQDRTKKDQKCFVWNHTTQKGKCYHCDTRFLLKDGDKWQPAQRREFKRPEWKNNTQLSDRAAKWFESRGIQQSILRKHKLFDTSEWMPQTSKEENCIHFPYFKYGELVNYKYRDGAKNFKLVKDAELVPYNFDAIDGESVIVIVEGEIDCLTVDGAGISYVCSVPNGAGIGLINFEWLDNSIDAFEDAEKIIIATDNDRPGINLRNQLAARLGVDRCYKVNFGDVKDANDFLIKYGAIELKKLIDNAEPFPVDGIFTSIDLKDELYDLYCNGMQPGMVIGDLFFDSFASVDFGRVYGVTGIPTHGKSSFVDYWISKLNLKHGVKASIFSPEHRPLQLHMSRYMELISGKRFTTATLSKDEYIFTKKYIDENFFWLNPEHYKVDDVLERAKVSVRRHGVKIIVLDPYNRFEHQRGSMSETDYASEFLDKLGNFAVKNNVAIFLVAHPTKMKTEDDGKHKKPTLYDINGSSNFYNKLDFGVVVYRDFSNNTIEVIVAKCKWKHLGREGSVMYRYVYDSGRFMEKEGSAIDNGENWLGFRSVIEPQKPIITVPEKTLISYSEPQQNELLFTSISEEQIPF